jgi:lipopolysaccharide transport system permease protein
VVQFGLYAAPVFTMTSKIPEKWRFVYSLNPVVGIIDGFRWSILGGNNLLYPPGIFASVAGVVFLVWTGIWYFRRTERTFADLV